MEKPKCLVADGIESYLFLIFVTIAGMAGKGKISKLIASAKNARYNVVDWKPMIE